MTLSPEQRKEFIGLIHDIAASEEFCKMKEYKHHAKGNTYEHCIHVAYLCYLHWIRTGCDVNIRELIRGALLHDYFLYDWREGEGFQLRKGMFHGFTHPGRALKNALRDYSDLSKTEEDMIKRHMFPLTPVPPHTKCGWLVCLYDKVAAIQEYGRLKNTYLNRIVAEEL